MTKQEYNDRNYSFQDISEDPRFQTCFREAMTVIGFWCVFVVLILVSMYVVGNQEPAEYAYVCGLPLWFFLVCAVILCGIGAVFYIVKRVFRDFTLDDGENGQAV